MSSFRINEGRVVSILSQNALMGARTGKLHMDEMKVDTLQIIIIRALVGRLTSVIQKNPIDPGQQ